MQSHYRNGMDQRYEDYEEEDLDEYEEEGSEDEEEEEKEPAMPSKEQQDFLKMREKLKEKIRKDLKKEAAVVFGHSSQSQVKKQNEFGTFFGPSEPVIASRVIDESRSIRETQHITSRLPSASSGKSKAPASSSSEKRTHVQFKKPKVVNEIKQKAKTLKDSRDYSEWLNGDDADLPTPAKERQAVNQKGFASNADYRSAQAPSKSQMPIRMPARPASIGNALKNPSKNIHAPSKLVSVKGAAGNRPKPVSTEPIKVVGGSVGAGPAKVSAGHKALHPRVPAQSMATNRPPAKVINDPSVKKKPLLSTIPRSSQENVYSQQKRPTQGLDKTRTVTRQPLPSAKPQSSKQIASRSIHEDRLRKPVKRKFAEDNDSDDAIQMIRNMFGYNPNRYVGADEDDSDMEADFDEIQKEERRSYKIAKKEDEEQLRLIEEEERKERMRKKQKNSRH